jgi:hypothetical protein
MQDKSMTIRFTFSGLFMQLYLVYGEDMQVLNFEHDLRPNDYKKWYYHGLRDAKSGGHSQYSSDRHNGEEPISDFPKEYERGLIYFILNQFAKRDE